MFRVREQERKSIPHWIFRLQLDLTFAYSWGLRANKGVRKGPGIGKAGRVPSALPK